MSEEKEEKELSQEEINELRDALGMPIDERMMPSMEKTGVYAFLNEVLKTDNSSKVGNLDKDELPRVRLYKDAAMIADVNGIGAVMKYLNNVSELDLSTSASKNGFLIQAAITNKRVIGTEEKKQKKRSWFGKKDEGGEQ
jgi:hypothetical protein